MRCEIRTSEQRLGWLLVVGTIPVGIVALLLEHTFRTILSRPVPTAVFLVINGLILLGAEALRHRATSPAPPTDGDVAARADHYAVLRTVEDMYGRPSVRPPTPLP